MYLANNAFSPKTAPFLVNLVSPSGQTPELENMEHGGTGADNGIVVVKMQGDLTFVHAFKIKDFLADLVLQEPPPPGADSRSEYMRYAVSSTLGRLRTRDSISYIPRPY